MPKRIVLTGLREDQLEVINNRAREKVVACGRKWGKTTTAMFFIVQRLFELGSNKFAWWVMPSYTQCRDVQREMKQMFKGSGLIKAAPKRPEFKVILSNNSEVVFKSTDKPEYLRGANPYVAVLDEARDMPNETWYDVIRPNLAARKAETLIISTPRTRHWFQDEFLRAKKSNDPNMVAWNEPSWKNPYMIEEAELLKKQMPLNAWRQEIAAEFVDEGGGVFENLEYVVDDSLPTQAPPEPNKTYFMGVDLAIKQDYTAVVIIDNHGVVRYIERFNRVTWATVEARILALANEYNATIILDSTGVGDPIYEVIKNQWYKTEPFGFSSKSKPVLIEKLILAVERREILLPPHKDLIDEMLNLRYDINDRGHISYAAPPNKHDDLVMALGLAVHGLSHNKSVGKVMTTKIILPGASGGFGGAI